MKEVIKVRFLDDLTDFKPNCYVTSLGTTSNDRTSVSPNPSPAAKPRAYYAQYNSFIKTTSAICTGPTHLLEIGMEDV